MFKKGGFTLTRRIGILLILLLSALSIYASNTLEEIVNSAKENSMSYKNSELSYHSGLMNVLEMEREDQPSLSLSFTADPYKSQDDAYMMTLSPQFSLTSADGDIAVSGGLSYSYLYDSREWSVGPTAAYSQTFDLTGYKSRYLDDLNIASSRLSVELSFLSSELSFQKSILTAIRQIIAAEKSLSSARYELTVQENKEDRYSRLGTYSEDSLTYKTLKSKVAIMKNSLKSQEQQYELSLANFKSLTGLDWNGITLPDSVELNLIVLKNGNSEVYQKSLSSSIKDAELAALNASINPNNVKLDASLSSSHSTSSYSLDTLTLSTGIGYNGKNWSISAGPTLSWRTESSIKPTATSLTIKGSWKNDTASSSDKTKLIVKQNEVLAAENDYADALNSYVLKSQELSASIAAWSFEDISARENLTLSKESLSLSEELLSRGLCTDEEVRSAENELKSAEYDWMLHIIDGLILRCDVESFAL